MPGSVLPEHGLRRPRRHDGNAPAARSDNHPARCDWRGPQAGHPVPGHQSALTPATPMPGYPPAEGDTMTSNHDLPPPRPHPPPPDSGPARRRGRGAAARLPAAAPLAAALATAQAAVAVATTAPPAAHGQTHAAELLPTTTQPATTAGTGGTDP